MATFILNNEILSMASLTVHRAATWPEPQFNNCKIYIHIALREEDPYFFDTFLAVLRSKLYIEKHNSKLQINL